MNLRHNPLSLPTPFTLNWVIEWKLNSNFNLRPGKIGYLLRTSTWTEPAPHQFTMWDGSYSWKNLGERFIICVQNFSFLLNSLYYKFWEHYSSYYTKVKLQCKTIFKVKKIQIYSSLNYKVWDIVILILRKIKPLIAMICDGIYSPLFVMIQVMSSNFFRSTIAYEISHNFELWYQWSWLRNEDQNESHHSSTQNVVTKWIVCNLGKYTKFYVVSICS